MLEQDHDLWGWFFQYLWMPILGAISVAFRGYRKEMADLRQTQTILARELESQKLYNETTFVRQNVIDKIDRNMERMDEKLDDLLKMIANGQRIHGH